MKFNIFLPLASALLILLTVIAFLSKPVLIYYLAPIIIVAGLFTSWSFCREAKNFSAWWSFSILPITTNLISLNYLMIQSLSDTWIIYTISAFLIVFNYIYWRYLYFYLNNTRRYQPFSLEYLSFYISFAIAFCLSAGIFGLRSFLELSVWWSAVIVGLALALILYQFSWISKYNFKIAKYYIIASWLMLMEIFFVLLYLPLNHNTLGFIWAAAYYLLLVIVNDRLKDKFTMARLRIYVIVALLTVIVTMLSARWL